MVYDGQQTTLNVYTSERLIRITHKGTGEIIHFHMCDSAQPERPTPFQLYKSCENKVAYSSVWDAAKASISLKRCHGHSFKIYECRYCGKYHLTTRRTAEV